MTATNRETLDDECTRQLATTALAVARRFQAGATMWCLAPAWPEHARHLAVEFVHPVVMGARALPAVDVAEPDPLPVLRTRTRPGDLLAIVGPGDGPTGALLRLAEVWGLTTIWVGVGDPAEDELFAHHRVQRRAADGRAARHDGSVVLLYHLLWELTQVCLEHRGLLREPDVCEGAVCITCADDAVPAEVTAVDPTGLARVRSRDGWAEVDTTLVDDVAPGDIVLVHAGTAISRIDTRTTSS